MALDLEAIKAKWLQVCPTCDGGIPGECSHPDEDYRTVIANLVAELENKVPPTEVFLMGHDVHSDQIDGALDFIPLAVFVDGVDARKWAADEEVQGWRMYKLPVNPS